MNCFKCNFLLWLYEKLVGFKKKLLNYLHKEWNVFCVGDKFFVFCWKSWKNLLFKHIFHDIDLFWKTIGFCKVVNRKCVSFLFLTPPFMLNSFSYLCMHNAKCLWKCVSSQSLSELQRELMLAIIHITCSQIDFSFFLIL